MSEATTPAGDKSSKKAATQPEPAAATQPEPAPLVLAPDAVRDSEMVTIHVQRGEGDDEKDGIYVGINGQHDFVVPRAVDVSVPYPVYEILANARRQLVNEDGTPGGEASRFAVSIVGQARRH